MQRKIGQIILSCGLFVLIPLWGQAAGTLGIKNFSKADYQAASQNWAACSGTNGFMYFANHNGLLEFDGTNWKLHKLPNETITRAVFATNDSIIYTSGYRELGYWKRNQLGQLDYFSLNGLVEQFFTKNEEFWNIASQGDGTYFHSFNKLIVYKNDTAVPVSLPGFTNTMQKIRDRILIAVANQGIFTVENGKTVPYVTDPFFSNKIVRFLLPYKENQLLIGTASHGIVVWDGKKLREWAPEWTDYFMKNELNRGLVGKNGEIILGTILDGMLVCDEEGRLIYKLNVGTGLQNNTVLGIATDQFDNIWLTLDSGIDFISASPVKGIRVENIPDIGAVYAAAVFQDKIYLGTNQGLFAKNLPEPNNAYRLVPGTQGQVWTCQVIDNQLFVGHNGGTFLIRDGFAGFIHRAGGVFSIRKDPVHPEYLIGSTYNNLLSFKKTGGQYAFSHTIDDFNDLIRYIEIDHLGNIWASHMHRGIYKLTLDDQREKVLKQEYFGAGSVFRKDHSLHVFKIENRIVFTTKNQLYTYDDLNNLILPYAYLNDRLGEYARSHRVVEAPDHHYWFITTESMALFYIYGDRVDLVKAYPSTIFENNQVIEGFENILPVSETEAILCLENGMAWLDASFGDPGQTIRYLFPVLRELQTINRRNEGAVNLPKNKYLKVSNSQNSVQVRYSFPHYTDDPVYYQYFLEGIDPGWSAKTQTPVFRFDRLPAGVYELKVKAIDLWNNESQANLLTLEILPPWYQSGLARVVYAVVLGGLLLLFRLFGIRKIRRKEQAEREKREQELIRLRNEKLNAEVSHKSKELANSTMAMIKKNEFLLELKEMVAEQKEQLGSRYPDKYYQHLVTKIDNNISSQDDWKLFETNFERAHEQFLKKMKDEFPDLTPKDLRLCAYLRLNLSSKEIAPLLGISVRGVENHRYRLRQRMGLEHDDNLIDLILKY
ncbi:helix-turn-helix and ligand-binding sensor domain-containing protein [Gaoshiqia sp. Z1-71]|uniref:helix-turn-helix and ligand-binding sensor domain-containing protein n=1 Tax=Gaoshiqia hydrogeniformans TaxID=3290090 RepID=UPI003BF78DFA